MHLFDFSEMQGDIPADIAELVSRIREIRALDGIRGSRYRREFVRVEEMAKLNSVKYSNEIEGIATSDERLADLVLRNDVPRTHSESEIAGYRDALAGIQNDPSAFDFDGRTVLGIHRTMMAHTLRGGGRYKVRTMPSSPSPAAGGRSYHLPFPHPRPRMRWDSCSSRIWSPGT